MAQQDQKATAPDNEGAANAFDGAVNAVNATSKNMQAIAGEIFEISKQSFEHTTQTLEKLRAVHGMDEVLAIQTNFVKEAFEHAAQHAQKFSELMTACQAEITKTYQDAWRAQAILPGDTRENEPGRRNTAGSFRSGAARVK